MKLYQSEQTGSIYFMDAGQLCQSPMNSSDGLIDLDNGASVDWDMIQHEPSDIAGLSVLDYLRNIEKELTK